MARFSKPPDGFNVEGSLTEGGTASIKPSLIEGQTDKRTLGGLYKELAAWATELRLRISPLDETIIGYGGWAELYAFTGFTLKPVADVATAAKMNEHVFSSFECPYCPEAETTIEIGTLFCTACEQFQICTSCRTAGTRLFQEGGARAAYCAKCCQPCTTKDCAGIVTPNSGSKKCQTCDPRGTCQGCKNIKPLAALSEHKSGAENTKSPIKLCAPCTKRFLCDECSMFHNKETSFLNHPVSKKKIRVCAKCADKLVMEHAEAFQTWDKEDMPTSGSLVLPAMDERPIRTMSIEIEFDGDGIQCSKALYRSGLIAGPNVERYGQRGDAAQRYPCMLKHDGSVSGGELVAFLLNLDDPKHADALLRTTEVMKGMQALGHAEFTHRAGGHVHVDAHEYGIRDCWNQYTIFKYLESTLYHLAGAGFKEGHRSLAGNNYASPPKAGPFKTLEGFAQAVKSESFGRSGLHFTNYSYAMRNCTCGASLTGKWENCKCDLGKATTEWRLWNATINPRILHGWLALIQAITAYAQENTNMSEDAFPYFNWARAASINSADKKKHQERMEWIFSELPLTTHERDSLVFVAKKSSLKVLGDEYLDNLLNIAGAAEKSPPKKKSKKRQSAQRQTNVEVRKVENPSADELVAVGEAFYDYDDQDEEYPDEY